MHAIWLKQTDINHVRLIFHSAETSQCTSKPPTPFWPCRYKKREYIVMHCSTERGVYSLKMIVTYCGLKTRRSIPLMHTHTLHTQRSPVAIDHVDADEWIKNTTIAVGMHAVEVSRGCVSTNLLSRQPIHSAVGDELGDVCTATIFPGRVSVSAVMLPEDVSRLSVVVGCAPSPPLCLELPHTTTGCRCCLHHGSLPLYAF